MMKLKRLSGQVAHWVGWFLLYLVATLLGGALLGGFLYGVIGAMTHPELSLGYRLSKGGVNGFYYAGVWATGLSIVLCVRRAHRKRQ